MTQIALEENASKPELLPELQEAHREAVEKLPQVFKPRKLQILSQEETVEQAKKFEPKVDQVLQVFTKLKRKKIVEEKTPPKSSPAEPSKEITEEQPEPSSGAAPMSNRKGGKKKMPIKPDEPAVTVAVAAGIPEAVPTGVPEALPTADVIVDACEEVDQTQGDRQTKRLKKKTESKDFSNGEFRADLQFQMERKWVAVRSSLLEIIAALKQKRQQGRSTVPIAAMDEIANICARLRTAGRRVKPFSILGRRIDQGADLIMLDIPTGRSIEPENDVPRWNAFPVLENYPRLLLNLAKRILDDNGYVVIFHSGSLESCQQIADTLEALVEWRHFLSYDVVNERGTYVPNSKIVDPPGLSAIYSEKTFWNDGLVSPQVSGLPVYAEKIAQIQAATATPSNVRAAFYRQDIHGRSLAFCDDEAVEAREESSGSPIF
ncbi:hypothetical protein R1sor_025057 [Riccia sorocarpa]|uniref:Uncharacterized protein n=1 Tax=Riccia sorocarpa TaxID=122646 RepID=A0ABD3GD65_9MARC